MMGTYYDGGSEMQTTGGGGGGVQDDHDNLQTLYLMNPNFIAATNYTEAQQQQQQQTPTNMVFLNPSNTINNFHHHHHQQFIGIPLAGGGSGSPSSSLQHHHIPPSTLHALSVSRVHPNLWGPPPNPTPELGDPMGFRRPVGPQGLSLSLSPGQGGQQHQSQVTTVAGGAGAGAGGSNGVIIGSKYLKAAQELLEEVANVGGHCSNFNHKTTTTASGNCNNNDDNNPSVVDPSGGVHKDKAKGALNDVGEGFSHGGESSNGGGSKKAALELTTPQRQELQMKKAKLLNMLDEVEQRYRQYDSQMQVVVNSFEEAAGIGSAKLYTSLALKTISKQFRCLKDAIMSQIKATSKSLGEEESNNNNNGKGVKLEGGGVAGSRLRFVDQQLRQQRALQQLGMMQHNAWRPQRGLPERAVSVLRAWLFEHFLHPYPKDSDKHMLAKQTGLTRSQVSNWFINARVRLWKPMVEEMYLEEMKTQEKNTPNSEDNNITNNKIGNSSPKNDPSSTTTLNPQHEQHQDHHESGITNDMISNLSAICTPSTQGFTLIGSSSDMESLIARSPKKQRSNSDLQNSPSSILSMDMEMKPLDHHQRHSFLMTNQGSDGFNPYIVNEIAGRFNPDQMTAHPYHGNAVSLTLGLPHCENLSLGNHHQQNFIPNQGIQMGRRIEVGAGGENEYCGISMAQPSHPNNAYQSSIDIQNRKRFAAHQLLHDFVA